MLTIKHIGLSGHEQIHECLRVWYSPKEEVEHEQRAFAVNNPGAGMALPRDTVYAATDEPGGAGQPLTFSDGTVFVMNSHGKTVSRYDLGPSMVTFADEAKLTQHAQRERERDAYPVPNVHPGEAHEAYTVTRATCGG
jgi:hypothetical protein